MNLIVDNLVSDHKFKCSALESDFPTFEISQIAEQESWRKEINRPIYHIHKWWATRLGSVFRAMVLGALSPSGTNIWEQFYEINDLKGKIVLDPFMGSGTTLGEAVKLGAKAIGCDVNPVSTFMVRQAFTYVSETELRTAFEQLEREVSTEIRHYYQTYDPLTGELIPVLYYFWVKTVETPEGEEIPLFSRYVFSQDAYPKKKPRAQIICPYCWNVIEDRYDANIVHCEHCGSEFNPQVGPANGQYVIGKNNQRYRIKDLISKKENPPNHRMYAMMALRSDGTKIYLPVKEYDLSLYKEAKKRLSRENLPLPNSYIRPGYNTDQVRRYKYTKWKDFFNDRQLLCLGLLLKHILSIENLIIQEQLICLFSSCLEFNNMFCSFKGEGTGAVRHMFNNHILKPERTPLENSVWGYDKSSGTFKSLFESRLLRAKHYLDEPFEVSIKYDANGNRVGSKKIIASESIDVNCVDCWQDFKKTEKGVLILNGDSSQLPIPSKTVDAVVTDPPYFDFVNYSELSDFFFSWLSPALRGRYRWMDRDDSSGQGEVQQKDSHIFSHKLSLVLRESCRVLKDDGVLTFSFHHSRAEGWAAIYEAIKAAGLAVFAVHPVHAELRGASPKNASKDPISLDALLVCRKTIFSSNSAQKYPCTPLEICKKVEAISNRLKDAGMKLSSGDRFVIGAALTLKMRAKDDLKFDEIKREIEDISRMIRKC